MFGKNRSQNLSFFEMIVTGFQMHKAMEDIEIEKVRIQVLKREIRLHSLRKLCNVTVR